MSVGEIDKEPARIAGMFDAIAQRYDLLNAILSGGLHRRWRRRAVRALRLTGHERVLDMCTGTADLAIEAATARTGHARLVVGIDFAGEMLRLGAEKVRRARLVDRVLLARGDATRVPLPDRSMDAAMVAFGIRNVVNPARGCEEFRRVLRPGGRLAVLEFGQPRLPVFRTLYAWYSRFVMPVIGRIVSRHRDAYSYLPASVQQFPSGPAFVTLLQHAGFSTVEAVPLVFGTVYLYTAERPRTD